MNVYQAINAVQKALTKPGSPKTGRRKQGATFKFRGIDDVHNALLRCWRRMVFASCRDAVA